MTLVEVNGKRIRLRNLDKEIIPGIPKARLIEYYTRVFPLMKPFLGRPTALKRCPDGLDSCFFQKNMEAPSWFQTMKYESESEEKTINWPVPRNLEDLVYLGELASLEIHATLSKDFKSPDIMVWDLDPEPPAGLDEVWEVAKVIKEILDKSGIPSFPKLSGKRGLHILTPVKNASWETTRSLVHAVGILASRKCDLAISEWIPHEKRSGKVFIDYLQNAKQKTIAIPYSPRAVPSATVSAPISWKEAGRVSPEDFTLKSLDWLDGWKDPWKGFWESTLDLARWKG